MGFDFKQKEFLSLANIIRREPETAIPFVGAGLSAYGNDKMRLPLWGELVDRLIETGLSRRLINKTELDKISYLRNSGQTISATDLILNCIGKPTFVQGVTEELCVKDKEVPPAIQKLIEITWSFIITTNLDEYIEKAWLQRFSKNLKVITHRNSTEMMRLAIRRSKDNETVLAKIHGTIDFPESWVLDSNAYRSIMGNGQSSYAEAMRALLLQNIFFVGYGMSDWDLDVLLDQISTTFPFGVGNAYALLSECLATDSKLQEMFRKSGVRPIWYQVDKTQINSPDAGHGQVLDCISALLREWKKGHSRPPEKWLGFPKVEVDFIGRELETKIIIDKFNDPKCLGLQILGSAGSGKTTLVRKVILDEIDSTINGEFTGVFGISFNRYNDSALFTHLHEFLFGNEGVNLDDYAKVQKICLQLTTNKYILVFDGIEDVLLCDGSISNPLIARIVMTISVGISFLICTTRTIINYSILEELNLTSFNYNNINSLLLNPHLSKQDKVISSLMVERLNKHALGMKLTSTLSSDQIYTFRNLRPNDNENSTENLVLSLLDSAIQKLTKPELALLKCIAISQRPISLQLVFEVYQRPLGENSINAPLVDIDLRAPIQTLIKSPLLQGEDINKLGLHPLVRESLLNLISEKNAIALHMDIANYLIEQTNRKFPETYKEAEVFFDICFHYANAQAWEKFHYVYYTLLNREHKNYLGNVIGSWDAFLKLAKMTLLAADQNPSMTNLPIIKQSYYSSCIARACKHLGKKDQAFESYSMCLKAALLEKSEETARYTNNFFSLSFSCGEINKAMLLLTINFSTLPWINEPWKKCWQEEYAFNSVGYLYGLLGFVNLGIKYCDYADEVWSRANIQIRHQFDYYRVYKVELLLLSENGSRRGAYEIAKKSMQLGIENNWLETEVTAICALALIERDKAIKTGNLVFIENSLKLLSESATKIRNVNLPRTEMSICLGYLKNIVSYYSLSKLNEYHVSLFKKNVIQVKAIIETSGFNLYLPELYAAQGWLERFKNNDTCARRFLVKAFNACNRNKTILFWNNSFYLTGALAKAFDNSEIMKPLILTPCNPETVNENIIDTQSLKDSLVKLVS